MRQYLYLFLAIFITNCATKHEVSETDEISLNGIWKFNTIYGMGSNPLNIHEKPTDILIESTDKENVKVSGSWTVKKTGQRRSVFHGNDYLSRWFKGDESSQCYVRFKPKVKKEGYYEALVIAPFVSHMTAQINVNHADGKHTTHLSQRINCGEWISVGIFKFKPSDNNYLEITAITDGEVAADAVLFRPIPEEKYKKAKQQPKQVFLPTYDDSDWNELKVPGHWGMLNSYSNYNGLGWYRKEFKVPKSWSSDSCSKYRLQFGGVYHVAKVYLNGTFIGRHQGGFTPFEFEVGKNLNFSENNILAVEVDNNFIVGATWNWGGIIRDVKLVKNNNLRIKNQYIHAEPDLEKGTASIELKVNVENKSNQIKSITIDAEISNPKKLLSLTKTVKVPGNQKSEIIFTGELSAEEVKLWHFDHPELYTIHTSISEGENILDAKTNSFGIRKIELTESKLLLNGEPVRIGGFNRVSEHRYWGSSEPIEILEKDIDLMKEAGANFMRIMHGTQNKKLIELCDKKGILLFEEVNVRDLTNPEFTAPEYPLIKSWIQGMVERDINHPCIIGWSVGNELTNHKSYAKKMIEYVKKIDPHRLVTCVSNSGQKEEATRETDPNTDVDIIMHNMYRWQGKPLDIINKLRSEWPEKPIFISEYGFDPYPSTSLDGDQEIFSEWHELWRGRNEFVIGTSLWTFNDYRSSYAGTTAEENRVWGLVNVWRQKRRMFNRVSKELSPVKDIQVTNIDFEAKNAEILIPIRGLNDYPSYVLNGYSLNWELRNINGKIIDQNLKNLPTIHPEDTSWDGEISWKNISKELLDLKIQLIAPTGYVRFEKIISFSTPKAPIITAVDLGNNSLRINFEKVPGALEYLVRYKNESGKTVESQKTITNSIEIKGLKNSETYTVSVIAINEKGESPSPKPISITPNGKLLAPKVWDAFIRDQKLIIGYTSNKEDDYYVVNYGNDENNLDKEFKTNVRGMMTIDLKNETTIWFKIKRIIANKSGNWSQVVKVKG
ncbi:glycoside hydrolase family 2 TIM barrel-domain containing protein [Flavicella marina]|uniref:glycoside hydrolase family 2 TIM barrel-domain containing protein n=1 Tax=Flavicella marina TaxID=1475951 RepID=UPI001264755B|nr:glycoside hydrolase family 2 TIM barrel-domain containing protein [Flavicella marina]